MRVSSWYLQGAGVAIDPLLPAEGIEWFEREGGLSDLLLTNRHHYRSSDALTQRYGATVHCQRAGLHEFTHGEAVAPFDFGDELPGGAEAFEIGVLTPEETALHLPAHSAVAIADSLVCFREGDGIGFVPDHLLGDDPEEVKRGLRAAYKRLLAEREFENLLLAHGGPILGDGRKQLARFLVGD